MTEQITDLDMLSDAPLADGHDIDLEGADGFLIKVPTGGAPKRMLGWDKKPIVLDLHADEGDLERAVGSSGVYLLYPYSRQTGRTSKKFIRYELHSCESDLNGPATHHECLSPTILQSLTKTIDSLAETIQRNSLTTCETNRSLGNSLAEQTHRVSGVLDAAGTSIQMLSGAKRPPEPEQLDVDDIADAVHERWNEATADDDPNSKLKKLLKLAESPLGKTFGETAATALMQRLLGMGKRPQPQPQPQPQQPQPPANGAKDDEIEVITIGQEAIDSIKAHLIEDLRNELARSLRAELAESMRSEFASLVQQAFSAPAATAPVHGEPDGGTDESGEDAEPEFVSDRTDPSAESAPATFDEADGQAEPGAPVAEGDTLHSGELVEEDPLEPDGDESGPLAADDAASSLASGDCDAPAADAPGEPTADAEPSAEDDPNPDVESRPPRPPRMPFKAGPPSPKVTVDVDLEQLADRVALRSLAATELRRVIDTDPPPPDDASPTKAT